MTFARLLWRNLLYHRRGNLAVLLGVAVGTAVLVGALLVGDSLRGSLRVLALRRLGWVDQAMVLPRFFREDLAKDLQDAGAAEHVCPALLLQGSVSKFAASRPPRSANKVTVYGVDERFLAGDGNWLSKPGSAEAIVYLNVPLTRALEAADGDEVVLHLQKDASVPRETLLGRRDASAVEQNLTLRAKVLPDNAPGSQFTLMPSPQAPRNAFVPLALLQDKLDLKNRVNGLLVGGARDDLQEQLHRHLKLADWELQVVDPRQRRGTATILPDYFSLESRRLVLEPAVAAAVGRAPRLKASPTLVYMINNIADERSQLGAAVSLLPADPLPFARAWSAYYGPVQVPYSVVAAVDLAAPGAVEEALRGAVKELKDDELVLVKWPGSPLKARPGDAVTLTWFRPQHGGAVEEETKRFRVAAVVKLEGALADAYLTPQVRGITDVRSYREWDPPFPFDRSRIRPGDENERFWTAYRTTPKAYLSLHAGQELWRSRFGDLTSIRIQPPQGDNPLRTVEEQLAAQLNPSQGGFLFEKVKENALAASRGGGFDFALLFLGFSFFLIASALLLVGLLFRLNLDRRAGQVGVLFASGFTQRTVRNLFLAEGAMLALLGGMVGAAAAVLYADFLLGRLRVWWPGGLEEAVLRLHVTPESLLLGYAAAVAVSALTVAWAVRVLGRIPPRALLQGQTTDEQQPVAVPQSRGGQRVAVVSLVGAVACLAAGFFVKNPEAQAGSFFGSGMLLLAAGLAGLTTWMGGTRHATVSGHGAGAVARLGVRNAARHPVRSLLTAGLLASAAFLLVGVESFRRSAGADYLHRDSGSGGFALLAESDLPVYVDLNSERGRDELIDKLESQWEQQGVGKESLRQKKEHARAVLREATFYAFRVRAGDDASCLNLYQPRRPRILGVPASLIDEDGFAFAGVSGKPDNPWDLLRGDAEEGVPVFGEQNTVTWMLKSGLGGTVEVPNWQGAARQLRIAGLLHDSVFQSGLLMSEKHFLDLFPDAQGYNFFLLRVPPEREAEVKELLEAALVDRGFEVTSTAERLEAYLAVENMYLSTFQALGGMGLLLGTLGLAVVLLRSVWERRGELALLRALGYRRRTLGWLVLAENSFLLLLGLGLGTLAALCSVSPHLVVAGGSVAWGNLVGMLGLALVVGLAASAAATAATTRAALIPALRRANTNGDTTDEE
ncbi:MAG: ABC transporter permease [Planctomycetes bacterium]|nr:ABC transporter permease [Planctomycetota bacterium]